MNIFTCTGPEWFIGLDISLELLFAITTMIIAFFAYKSYKVVRKNEILFFSIGFFSIALGYLQQVIFNISRTYGFQRDHLAPLIGPVAHSLNLGFLVALTHIVLFTFGLTLIVYLTFPKRNKKLFITLIGLSLIALFTSWNIMFTSFLISSLLLLAITIHFYQLLARKKTKSAMYNYLGFGAIFLGQFQLAISTQVSWMYVLGHIVTLVGYWLILLNLHRVLKNE